MTAPTATWACIRRESHCMLTHSCTYYMYICLASVQQLMYRPHHNLNFNCALLHTPGYCGRTPTCLAFASSVQTAISSSNTAVATTPAPICVQGMNKVEHSSQLAHDHTILHCSGGPCACIGPHSCLECTREAEKKEC